MASALTFLFGLGTFLLWAMAVAVNAGDLTSAVLGGLTSTDLATLGVLTLIVTVALAAREESMKGSRFGRQGWG